MIEILKFHNDLQMPTIEDHSFLKICAELANCLSISLASARRKVDLAASRAGSKDLASRKIIAEKLLTKARLQCQEGNQSSSAQLDILLQALEEEENFMTED